MSQTYSVLGTTALNDPRGGIGPRIHLQNDGRAVFASFSNPGHQDDFINLQESPAGFGNTKKEAVIALLRDANMKCRQPLWFGYGGPAGHCGSAAYSSEIHPNSISLMLSRECARCSTHGGFDVGAAAALALMYRTFGEVEEFSEEGDDE